MADNKKEQGDKFDVRQDVTDRIIKAMESGLLTMFDEAKAMEARISELETENARLKAVSERKPKFSLREAMAKLGALGNSKNEKGESK